MSVDRRLKRTQQNEIYQLVSAYQFVPSEFGWTEEVIDQLFPKRFFAEDSLVSVLSHHQTKFFCKFGPVTLVCSPGHDSLLGTIPNTGLIESARVWVEMVQEEINAPNLWANAMKGPQLAELVNVSPDSDVLFTQSEREFIRKQLDSIAERLIESENLNEERSQLLKQGFAQLSHDAERLSKKDWKNTLIATLVGMGINGVFDPNRLTAICDSIAAVFVPILRSVLETPLVFPLPPL